MNAQMKFQTPNHTQLKTIVEEFGMHMSDKTIQEFLDAMQDLIQEYAVVDSMSDYLPSIDYARSQVFFPKDTENPYNAWYVTTEIRGASDGPLLGKRVALKDNICVAGVPMMNGASTLQGYTPDIDATIVTRLLDAGATIAGKAHCEYFCVSGGSHTNALGPVHNPTGKVFPPVAPPPAQLLWSVVVLSIWQSEVIKVDQSEFQPHIQVVMALNLHLVLFLIRESCRLIHRLIT